MVRTLFFTFFKDSTIVISFCERALSALRELLLAFNLIIFVAIFFKERREGFFVASLRKKGKRNRERVNFLHAYNTGRKARVVMYSLKRYKISCDMRIGHLGTHDRSYDVSSPHCSNKYARA